MHSPSLHCPPHFRVNSEHVNISSGGEQVNELQTESLVSVGKYHRSTLIGGGRTAVLTSVCEVQVRDLSIQARDQRRPLCHRLQGAEGLRSLEPHGWESREMEQLRQGVDERENMSIMSRQEAETHEREIREWERETEIERKGGQITFRHPSHMRRSTWRLKTPYTPLLLQ